MGNPNWKPGVSGNPGGRPKLTQNERELKELCRQHSPAAVATLVGILTNAKASPSARVAACRELLDRGYGRAESSVNAKIETPEIKPDFSVLSPEQREVWKRGHAMLAPLLELVLHERSGESPNGNGHEG